MSGTKLSQLDNGVRIVTRSAENFESAAMGYWVEAGGVCEDESNCGISHFEEHMAFKGTISRSAKQITEEIESAGGFLNAYTSKETTAFHAKVLKEDLKSAVDILSDILQNPTFPEDELEREREVILQEILQSRDTPDDIIFDHFQNVAFAGQSLGRPILGSPETVSRIKASDLRSYRSQYYNADNIIFAAVGDINHDELSDLLAEHLSSLKICTTDAHEKKYDYRGGVYSDIRDLEQTHLIIGFEGLSCRHEDYHTMGVLASILGGGMSSRLFQEVREKRGLAYSICSFSSSYKQNGLFGVYAATSVEKLTELANTISGEFVKICENISEKELERTKAMLKSSLLMAQESNSASCERIVNQALLFKRIIENEEILQKINSITVKDVIELAKKTLASGTSVVTVGKGDASPILSALQSHGIS